MTIINPHNVQQLYLTWFALLLSTVILAGLSYYVSVVDLAPFIIAPPISIMYALCGYAGIASILGLLFKFVFRRPIIGWAFVESVGVAAVVMTFVFDLNLYSIVLHGVAIVGMLCLGPYLHFE